jgi:hypothetical protein
MPFWWSKLAWYPQVLVYIKEAILPKFLEVEPDDPFIASYFPLTV